MHIIRLSVKSNTPLAGRGYQNASYRFDKLTLLVMLLLIVLVFVLEAENERNRIDKRKGVGGGWSACK